jgi:hypothetical protein
VHTLEITTFTDGKPGAGGAAGPGGPVKNSGGGGLGARCWNFATNAACGM